MYAIRSYYGFEAHLNAELAKLIRNEQRIAVATSADEQFRTDGDRFSDQRGLENRWSSHRRERGTLLNLGKIERESDFTAVGWKRNNFV